MFGSIFLFSIPTNSLLPSCSICFFWLLSFYVLLNICYVFFFHSPFHYQSLIPPISLAFQPSFRPPIYPPIMTLLFFELFTSFRKMLCSLISLPFLYASFISFLFIILCPPFLISFPPIGNLRILLGSSVRLLLQLAPLGVVCWHLC